MQTKQNWQNVEIFKFNFPKNRLTEKIKKKYKKLETKDLFEWFLLTRFFTEGRENEQPSTPYKMPIPQSAYSGIRNRRRRDDQVTRMAARWRRLSISWIYIVEKQNMLTNKATRFLAVVFF